MLERRATEENERAKKREQERKKVEGRRREDKEERWTGEGPGDEETKKETIELLPTQRLSYLMIYSSVSESR